MLHGGAGRTEPSWGYFLTYECRPGTFGVTRAACQTLTTALTQPHAPRAGVVTYAFTCLEGTGGEGEEEPSHINMLELFADDDAAASHLTENEGEAMVEMFQSSLQLRPGGATVVNVNQDDKQLQAALDFSSGLHAMRQESTDTEVREARRALGDQSTRFVWPAAGRVINSSALANKHMERFPDLRPPGDSGVLIELRAEPETAEAGAATKEALCKVIPQHDTGFVSCFVSDAWWAGASKHGVGMHMVAGRPDFIKALVYRSALAAARDATSGTGLTLVLTAQDWEAEPLLDLIEYFADSQIPLVQRRRLFAGFILHPCFCRPWHARLADEKQRAAERTVAAVVATAAGGEGNRPPAASASSGDRLKAEGEVGGGGGKGQNVGVGNGGSKEAEAGGEQGCSSFSLRRHAVTNVAQAIVLHHQQHVAAGATKDGGNEVLVPLAHLLHKVCRLGRNDSEIPIGMVYAQLNYMRALLRDADTLNTTPNERIEADEELALRMHTLLEHLSSLGSYP
jgi:hypothetical protein